MEGERQQPERPADHVEQQDGLRLREPQSVQPLRQQLEYQFAASAPLPGGGEKVYAADQYWQGRLDWYSLDVDGSAPSLGATAGSDPQVVSARTMLPTPLRYPGMPQPRWWTFEDGQTNFGAITPDTRTMRTEIDLKNPDERLHPGMYAKVTLETNRRENILSVPASAVASDDKGPFVLTVAGFALLTLGGWLGGAVVFVHGMRVLNLVDEPALRAAAPVPTPEKEEAEAG